MCEKCVKLKEEIALLKAKKKIVDSESEQWNQTEMLLYNRVNDLKEKLSKDILTKEQRDALEM